MEMLHVEEGLPMEEEMSMEEPIVSDEIIEYEYLDFILDEALEEEEENFATLVHGCIDASDGESRRTVQNCSRSTIFDTSTHLCTASDSNC